MVGVKDNGEPDIGSSTLLHFSVMVMAVTLAMRLMINIVIHRVSFYSFLLNGESMWWG